MKKTIIFLVACSLFACKQNAQNQKDLAETNDYNTYIPAQHLLPSFEKAKFDTLHKWDFGWALLEPIDKGHGNTPEAEFATRLAPGQKALHYFWYLDAEVTNGGFIQFYWNGYQKYVPPLKEGLKLIGDSVVLALVEKSEQDYQSNQSFFNEQLSKEDWKPLYDQLKNFDKYDSIYYKNHDTTMALIEKYARNHPEEFVKFNYVSDAQ